MAEDKKISALPRLTEMTDADLFPVVSGGANYAATAQTIKTYATADSWFEALAKQFEALAGNRGTVDRTARRFTFNGVTNINAVEMYKIIASPWNSGENFYNPQIRTAPILRGLSYYIAKGLRGVFCNNAIIETVENVGIQVDTLTYCFYNCAKLRAVCALTSPIQANWVSSFGTAFRQCPKLEYVGIMIGNCTGLSFADSPLITAKCLTDLVTNARNTNPVTVTLHATTYAALTDTLISAAAAKQITFASA